MLNKSDNVYLNIDNLIQFDEALRSAVITAMKNKYLEMHTGSIWIDSKNLYCTKLGGKKKTSTTKEGLEKKIVEYYKSLALSFYEVMINQLQTNLQTKSIDIGTYDRYLVDYNRFVKNSTLEKVSVCEATETLIKSFLEKQISNGISRKNFNNLVSLLNVVYFYSDFNNINVSNIKKKMNLKPKQFDKSNKRETTDIVWTDEEQQKLLAYAEQCNDIKILGMVFMLQTGLAISELVQLHKEDINLEDRELTVKRIEKKYKIDGKTIYTVSEENSAKTEARLGTVYLSQKAIETYNKILKLSTAHKPDDLLFNGYHSYDFDTTLRRKVLKDLKLSKRGLHSFRKTYGTNLIDAKVPLSIVQKQMRHADIQTTLKFYYKRKSKKEDTLNLLDKIA